MVGAIVEGYPDPDEEDVVSFFTNFRSSDLITLLLAGQSFNFNLDRRDCVTTTVVEFTTRSRITILLIYLDIASYFIVVSSRYQSSAEALPPLTASMEG